MTVQGLSDLLWTQEQKTLERNVEDNPDEKLQEFQTGANFVHGAETPVTPNKLPFLEDADNKLSNVSERKNFDIIGLDDEEKHCPTTEGRDIKKSLRKSRNPLVADLDFSPKDAVSSKGKNLHLLHHILSVLKWTKLTILPKEI